MVAMASKNAVVEEPQDDAAGVNPMALALGACGGLALLVTGSFGAWLKLRAAKRSMTKDVEQGVVAEEKPQEAKDDIDDNASTATPDSLAQSVESRRESLAMETLSP